MDVLQERTRLVDTSTNNNVLPRFSSGAQDQKYQTLNHIQTHAPHMLEQNQQIQSYIEKEHNLEFGQEQQQKKLFCPTAQLLGHQGEVYCVKFSPDGDYLASAGFDKQIFLWDVYNECKNFAVLKGHTNAILELHWSTDGHKIYTASADKTMTVWEVESQKSLKRFKDSSFVNTCHPARRGPDLIVSGNDDGVTKIWDLRQKNVTQELHSNPKPPVTAVSFNDTAEKVFVGGLDNQIKVYDLRKRDIEYTLYGHTDTITGVALSHDGSYLLSNSMDQTIRCFDIKPYVVKNRCVKIYQGSKHSHEKNLLRVGWSADGEMITAGSSDRYLYIWDSSSKKIIHKLGGHNGSVNETVFSPVDRITASASSDRSIIVGQVPQYGF